MANAGGRSPGADVMRPFGIRILRAAARLALPIAIAAPALPAAGQSWEAPVGIADAFRMDFLRRDLSMMAEELRLDDTQAAILQALCEDYEKAFADGSERVRQELANLRPPKTEVDEQRAAIDAERNQRYADLLEEYRRKRAELPPDADDSDLRAQIQEQAEAIREEIGQVRPPAIPADEHQRLRARSTEILAIWDAERTRLREDFVTNVQAILVADQLERWPSFERRLRRQKSLPRGQLSGESVDLLRVLRDLRFEADLTEPLRPVLDQYELELDAALQERDAYLKRSEHEIAEAMLGKDRARADAIIERMVEQRRLVRDVNVAAAMAIAQRLPDTEQSHFEDHARRRMFPRVYRATQAERALRAASDLEDLDPEVVAAVSELLASFDAEIEVQHDQLRQLLLQHEPDQLLQRSRQRLLPRQGRPATRTATDPIQAHFRQRYASSQSYLVQLQAILTPEQFDRLRADHRGGVRPARDVLRSGPGKNRTFTPRKPGQIRDQDSAAPRGPALQRR
jgi:hypothetical protein